MSVPRVFLLLLALAGCDKSRVYETDRDFADRSWKAKDSIKFEFEVGDSTQQYNLYYRIRNSNDYPYSRLFVRYSLAHLGKTEIMPTLVSNYLFDQKTGVPLGSSGIGDTFDHQFLLKGKMKFNHQGKHSLMLEQFMRLDTLSGIEAVGLRVEKDIN
jgi:gliding motility-associated lipoprotein GldH